MEYYGSCILKTQMLPAFIRYAVINKNEEQTTKSILIRYLAFIIYIKFQISIISLWFFQELKNSKKHLK